ncbi:MAG: S-layer homology domain-containing protein [Eubacteriales bacterium]|nr:S-layer homology domain-containing protein [Eubacteriales bacterium]
MKKRLWSFLLALTMCVTLLPVSVGAVETTRTPTRTTTLDLTAYTETTDMLDSEGWKWEPTDNGGTLTLRNCYLQSDTPQMLQFNGNDTITIVLEGENILETTSNSFNAAITSKNSTSAMNFIIREGEGGGSLDLVCSAEIESGKSGPYAFAGNSITMQSGTVTCNMNFCTISGDVTMNGGSLSIDNTAETNGDGIYTNAGSVTINGGTLYIKASRVGIGTVGVNVDSSVARNVTINDGDVTIEAGVMGITTYYSADGIDDVCDVYINGGNVDITSNNIGIRAKNIVIDSDGSVKVHGDSTALYQGISSTTVPGKIEIIKAGELELTGTKITSPEQTSEDKTQQIIIAEADYTAVDTALEKVEALDANDYVDFSAVQTAVDQVVRGKTVLEQAEVDAMAQAIEDAIAGLVEKLVVTVAETENGSVTVSAQNPAEGDTVIITPVPDEDYAVDTVTVTDADGNAIEVTPGEDGTYTFTQPASNVTVTVTYTEDKTDPDTDCDRGETCPVRKFTDTNVNAWYHDGVHYCVENGLMVGMDATTFAPSGSLTRAQLAQILYNEAGKPAVTEAASFTDVSAGAWYADAVAWAEQNSIIYGVGDGTFAPNAPVSRQEIAAMLYRHAGSPAVSGSLDFQDAEHVSTWATDAMLWAVQNGIIAGIEQDDGTVLLNAKDNATRAQAATMLHNVWNP